jgi:hypothetical protein
MHANGLRLLAVTSLAWGLAWGLACASLPAQNAPAADDPIDSQEAREFRVTVRQLFNAGSFAKLENIAETARSEKSRFRGGAWKLNVFYATVQGPGSLTSADSVWEAHIARLSQWAAAYPASATPHVALARAYIRYAWKARGMGYAKTVTDKGWQLYRSRMQQARATLEAAQAVSAKDPRWYRSMQDVALAQRWPRAQVDQLLESAIAAEPNYYYFYIAQANFLLPRWYGKTGEAEAFAQSIADRIGGQEGDAIYFRIAEDMDCCGKRDRLPALSWDRIKEGFAALESLYGSINYQRNVMAYLAVRNKDQEFAARMFVRIGDDWNQDVWGSKANFDSRTVAAPEGKTAP